MKILIAGDLVPTTPNIELFNNAETERLLGDELFSIWNNADVRLFNLEVPLTDTNKPIKKHGPNLCAPVSTINGINDLRPTLVSLANNHILDQDEQGLYSTIKLLSEKRIPFIGAGNNLQESKKPYIFNKDNLTIGIYSCTESEFSTASDANPGANPFDPFESFDDIERLKEKCNYVIVLYHGGKEHYRYPSPYLQKVCRRMVKKGADLVVCQHSHCIGCYETFENATIVYGQGNFIFDKSQSEYWKTSILVEIQIEEAIKIRYIPIVKAHNAVKLADSIEAKDILYAFELRSKNILKNGFIEAEYKKFSEKMLPGYLNSFLGEHILYRICYKILKKRLLKIMFSSKSLLKIQNYIECEAHRELFIMGLKNQNR